MLKRQVFSSMVLTHLHGAHEDTEEAGVVIHGAWEF